MTEVCGNLAGAWVYARGVWLYRRGVHIYGKGAQFNEPMNQWPLCLPSCLFAVPTGQSKHFTYTNFLQLFFRYQMWEDKVARWLKFLFLKLCL